MSNDLGAILLIMTVVWGVGMLFRAIKLPLLLGELLAGLIIGPAVLGWVHETEAIKILAEFGIFFMMLHAGLETEPKQLFQASKSGIWIALGGVVLPVLLGVVLARAFGVDWIQACFLGIALSITAISVTVKIFKDMNYGDTHIKNIVMAAAVADDILAFFLVSVLLSIAGGHELTVAAIGFLVIKLLAFFGTILFIGEKVLPHLAQRFFNSSGGKAFTLTLVVALGFGFIAETMGIHFVIGAYMAGLFLKEEFINDDVYAKIEDRLFGMSYSFLGPIFFVSLGFHLSFGDFLDWNSFLFLVLFILAGVLGKVFGAGLLARWTGQSWRNAGIIGFSMNGRGAVELVLATIGLEAGIITESMFSMLVVMAFVTTFITPIGLKFLLPKTNEHGLMQS
jgi:Kef-type K+ transport system membrane component KefB